jgi:hypothetical protein
MATKAKGKKMGLGDFFKSTGGLDESQALPSKSSGFVWASKNEYM